MGFERLDHGPLGRVRAARFARSRVAVGLAFVALLSLGATCVGGVDLATRLAEGDRSAADKARDAGRRPAAVVRFLGIEPGMTVVDLIAAGGYYTEVFAEAVGPRGTVYAHNIDFVLKMRGGVNERALAARLADDRLPNVERLDQEFGAIDLPPGSVDVVFTALNMHDIIDGQGPEVASAVLDEIHGLLRPGGVLGIVDHAGDPDAVALNKQLHRIDERRVVELVEAAGFEIEASSDALRNPADDHTVNVFAPEMRGRTDRFVLRARKPG